MHSIDRLITVLILQLVCNVWRQRHLAKLIQDLLKDAFIFKPDHTVAIIHNLKHLSFQKSLSKTDDSAGSCLLSRSYQSFPDIPLMPLKQEYFDMGTCILLGAEKSCRYYLGVIDHQAVSRVQKINNFLENVVADLTAFPVQNHQS